MFSIIMYVENYTTTCNGKTWFICPKISVQLRTYVGFSRSHEVPFLFFSAVLCILFCAFYLALEVVQLLRRGRQYFLDYENYVQVFLHLTCLFFVFPVGHEEWCFPRWRWAFGALAILFLAWLNSILVLKSMPYIGQSITMLFNVYFNFIKLIYLPILLVLTFGFSFYMLLVYEESSSTCSMVRWELLLLYSGNPHP